MGLRTFKTLIRQNKAPRGAKYIGIYRKNGDESTLIKKINITHTNLENNEADEPLYSFGVLSDIHMMKQNQVYDKYAEHFSEAWYDFANAIQFLQNNGVKFVCACGDMGVNSDYDNYNDANPETASTTDTDWETAYEILKGWDNVYKASGEPIFEERTIPFFTSMGNHDTVSNAYRGGSLGREEKIKEWFNKYWFKYMFLSNEDRINTSITNEIFFQQWNSPTGTTIPDDVSVWSSGEYTEGIDTYTEKTGSFYFVKEYNVEGESEKKKDVFIFFSLYYGTYYENVNSGESVHTGTYPNLRWLNKVLNEHRDDRCFVFTHVPFYKKSGNLYGDTSKGERNGCNIYNNQSVMLTDNTYNNTDNEIGKRLNILNNYYKNSIWFFGHTHYKWMQQKYFRRAHLTETDPQNNEIESVINIGVPSCAYPRDIVDVDLNSSGFDDNQYNNRVDDWDDSEGALVNVYKDRIEIIGIKFKDGDNSTKDDNIHASSDGEENYYNDPRWVYESGWDAEKVREFLANTYKNQYQPIAYYACNTEKRDVEDGSNILNNV